MVKIEDKYINEAFEYAYKSREFTSNNHDFHEGGLDAKQRKMFEGKLGEKIFKQFLIDNSIAFEEDSSHHTKADEYDFKIVGRTYANPFLIDVKTRTKEYHTRTLEMVKQFKRKPKHIYISVKLDMENKSGYIIGWFGKRDLQRINRIENNGYLDNYVMYDNELRDIYTLTKFI
tara:strand:+ start:3188 stop:3709 length:522 start_codon:yes stop_codon:yes gene_type:complete